MKSFRVKHYEIKSKKIKNSQGVTFAVLTDLHGLEFGRDNERLLQAVEALCPDCVLIAGDMFVNGNYETCGRAFHLVKTLAGRYPVYYSLGNHEYKMYLNEETKGIYLMYERRLRECGVRFLRNTEDCITLGGAEFCVHGLELPLPYYHKPNSPGLPLALVRQLLGRPKKNVLNIMLAHNPKYGKTYLHWGADLIVCGHYHGGVLRLTEHVGLSSPQYLLFPPFCCGDFHRGNSHMIVSAGLGEHTIPLRIHNPREMIAVTIKPLEK